MLLALLKNNGKCSVNDIAREISRYDPSQNEYYQKITNNMVGRVLRNHNIVAKDRSSYYFLDYKSLSTDEISALIKLCIRKLDEYLDKRGNKIWTHRRKTTGYISGTLKYEVLKRAKFHCELCGISADERALEVDHIKPRNKGGSDGVYNLQSLCYKCNAMKRDRDATDFRETNRSFKNKDTGCLFCNIESERITHENELVYSILDGFPVSELHTLIIPKRHVKSYFALGQSEINACTRMLNEIQQSIRIKDTKVQAFNIGVNDGDLAGQTIPHCHIHLIPRRAGDTPTPRGGVRGVIPAKMNY